MNKPIHRINDAGTAVVCAAPEDADCRKRSHCDSEGWHFDTGCTDHGGKHPAVPGSDCWMTEYINAIELAETFEDYENPPEIIAGAAIDLDFIGRDEGCCWSYADREPVTAPDMESIIAGVILRELGSALGVAANEGMLDDPESAAKSAARAVLAALSEARKVEYGVRWDYISEMYPERTDWAQSPEDAQTSIDKSFATGSVVTRIAAGPWMRAE